MDNKKPVVMGETSIFIFTIHLGIRGAALATVISQCISVGMSFYYFFFSGKSHFRIKVRHFLLDFKNCLFGSGILGDS
ncbi:MAG: hypothetical protein ACERKN_06545 [Velocimicrobium sp.]